MYELSVISPSWNKADHLRRQLLSLSVQTFPHDRFEVIVVDDGSTDHTKRVVDEARTAYDFPLRYYFLNRPGRHSSALPLNFGIKRADSSLIIHAGADTLLARDALTRLHDYVMDSDGTLMVFGRAYCVHSRLAESQLDFLPWTQDIHVLESVYMTEYGHSPTWRVPMVSALRREVYTALHGYDESYPARYPDDSDFWVRAEASGIVGLNPPDVWAAHQYHPSVDPVCGDDCPCPLSATSKTHPGPAMTYRGTPEDLVRNRLAWGEWPDSYEC